VANSDSPVIEKANFSEDGLREWRFEGFLTIAHLSSSNLKAVPWSSGVYALVRPDLSPPVFLPQSSGGRWKSKDPNVPLEKLKAAWVDDAVVLYFGKATSLRDRIGLFLDFGAGKDVMHYGGRYIWHIDRTDRMQLAWVVTDPPSTGRDPARDLEQLLIRAFQQVYGARPFANLQG
jgi:hypothetical protein